MPANSKTLDPEDELLSLDSSHDSRGVGSNHAVRTAPVFTKEVLDVVGNSILPQRALYGSILAQRATGFSEILDPSKAKLYVNTNSPFSGVVCGVQGSGKSHSTAVLLESCLIRDPRVGTLPAPLTGLVFHYDTAAGGGVVQPCEAAYLSSIDPIRGGDAVPPQVTVLVVPNNVHKMRRIYSVLPNVTVAPLHFAPEDISGDRLLAMMKVDTDSQMPLYMEVIMGILRSMDDFDYGLFRQQLKEQSTSFSPVQKSMMSLRLSLLDSCLKDGHAGNKVSSHFKPGQLTIVDLSSPFMDAMSACSFFDIILGLFVEHRPFTRGTTEPPPKLVVLDEAHKYLTDGGAPSRLTESLLSIIRQQRHENMRVLISTQEPTVVPSKFLDLCSFIVAHRFSSPGWLKHLAQHVSAADGLTDYWASKVVALQTGEAMFFAPAGLAVQGPGGDSDESTFGSECVAPIGQGYFLVRSRLRITQDGGQSLLAVRDEVLAAEEECKSDQREPSYLRSSSADSPEPSIGSSSPFSGRSESLGAHSPTSGATSLEEIPAPPSKVPPTSYATVTPQVSEPITNIDPGSQYARLLFFLGEQHYAGITQVLWAHIGEDRRKHPLLYPLQPMKLRSLLQQAKADGVVELGEGGKPGNEWARSLVEPADTTPSHLNELVDVSGSDGYSHHLSSTVLPAYADVNTSSCKLAPASLYQSRASISTSPPLEIPVEWRGLVARLQELQQTGPARVTLTRIGDHRHQHPHLYTGLPTKMKQLAAAAQLSGIVTTGGAADGQWVQLATSYASLEPVTLPASSTRVPPFAPPPPLGLSGMPHVSGGRDSEFSGLVNFLRERLLVGIDLVEWSAIGEHRGANPAAYPPQPQRLKSVLELAQAAGVIECGNFEPGRGWAKLRLGLT